MARNNKSALYALQNPNRVAPPSVLAERPPYQVIVGNKQGRRSVIVRANSTDEASREAEKLCRRTETVKKVYHRGSLVWDRENDTAQVPRGSLRRREA